MKKNSVIVILALLTTTSIGFFGGMKYQMSKGETNSRFFSTRGPGIGNRDSGATRQISDSRPIMGEIISHDEAGLIVKLADGSSKIIILPQSIQIRSMNEGSREDLTVGQRVMIAGSQNTDGSITAETVQLNPLTFREIPESKEE